MRVMMPFLGYIILLFHLFVIQILGIHSHLMSDVLINSPIGQKCEFLLLTSICRHVFFEEYSCLYIKYIYPMSPVPSKWTKNGQDIGNFRLQPITIV